MVILIKNFIEVNYNFDKLIFLCEYDWKLIINFFFYNSKELIFISIVIKENNEVFVVDIKIYNKDIVIKML